MRTKSLILLIISIGCGLVASFAVSQVMTDKRDGSEVQTSGVLVTTKDLSPMAKMTADSVRVEQWPVDRIPSGAVAEVKDIEGKYAKQRMYTGEPIIEAKLSARGKDLVVPVGYRIFDVRVDENNGGSGYISPGDRVDITGFFEAGNRFPVSKSIRIMRNIEVAMVDGVSFRDPEAGPKRASTIQLLVLEKQYEVLDTASNLGKLKLSLRAPESDALTNGKTESDTGESFLGWLKESEKKSDASGVVASTANSLSMLKGLFAAMKPTPKEEEKKEMLVLTPGSVSIYRWVNGRRMPILISPEEYYGNPGSTQGPNASSSGLPESKYISTQTPSVNEPAPSTNASKPAATWDPQTGTWQTGGFTPVYPQSK